MFRSIYFLFVRSFKRVVSLFFRLPSPPVAILPVLANKTHHDMACDYTRPYLHKFNRSFENLTTPFLFDKNIDTLFYDPSEYKTMLEASPLEKEWRSRILFEYTPRGNVIMYYDAYRLGFAYYADQYVPYDILNAVAMKYVLTFQCRDFFVDDLVRPENRPSKLLPLIAEPEKKEKTDVTRSLPDTKNGPFAKLKNYSMMSKKDEETIPATKKQEKEKCRNRFIQQGKLFNFSMLQKPVKKPLAVSSTIKTLEKGLFENAAVQKEVFSYRDYKQRLLRDCDTH
jgi:hypothetical protein